MSYNNSISYSPPLTTQNNTNNNNKTTESGPALLTPQPKWDLCELQTYALRNNLKIQTPLGLWYNKDMPYVMETQDSMFTVFSNVNKELVALLYHKHRSPDTDDDVLSRNPIWTKNLNAGEYTGTVKLCDKFCIQLFTIVDQYGENVESSCGGFSKIEVTGSTNLVLKCKTNSSGVVSADLVLDDRVILKKKGTVEDKEITIAKTPDAYDVVVALYNGQTLIQVYRFRSDAQDFVFKLPTEYCLVVTDCYKNLQYMSQVVRPMDVGPGYIAFVYRDNNKVIGVSLVDNDNMLLTPTSKQMKLVIQAELDKIDQ